MEDPPLLATGAFKLGYDEFINRGHVNARVVREGLRASLISNIRWRGFVALPQSTDLNNRQSRSADRAPCSGQSELWQTARISAVFDRYLFPSKYTVLISFFPRILRFMRRFIHL